MNEAICIQLFLSVQTTCGYLIFQVHNISPLASFSSYSIIISGNNAYGQSYSHSQHLSCHTTEENVFFPSLLYPREPWNTSLYPEPWPMSSSATLKFQNQTYQQWSVALGSTFIYILSSTNCFLKLMRYAFLLGGSVIMSFGQMMQRA